jgi:hypothetical protein
MADRFFGFRGGEARQGKLFYFFFPFFFFYVIFFLDFSEDGIFSGVFWSDRKACQVSSAPQKQHTRTHMHTVSLYLRQHDGIKYTASSIGTVLQR